MNREELDKLVKYQIITDAFDYQELDPDIVEKYKYFEDKFNELLAEKANQFKLKDCHFVIKNHSYCNAFARTVKGYNIIGITTGYTIQMHNIFDQKNIIHILLIALMGDQQLSHAYADLYNLENFELNKFMLNCSIQFTFSHEFRHILQFNSSKISVDYYRNENLDHSTFEMKKHAWEFDADRMASFEVMKYIFKMKRKYQVNDDNIFKCMLYTGLGSIFITKVFFYFRFETSKLDLNKIDFYTKKYSHPHPIVRMFNIIDYFYDNITDFFPKLEVTKQDFLNNALGIIKLYFFYYQPNRNIIAEILNDIDNHLNEINDYNEELFEFAINDTAIVNLLNASGTNFH
ncbi:hypothetical protein LF887_14105 [Chryseobacterium sp. MEBOG06]|uniref:hypothetical protein n=1 Tax=Chryseobacterium sp. MEBOG06 TaxID=2879938 RepID=UPI001F35608A|nr:hypothetical protein [Chryseobacterium sp. MEBOG06]UKB82139.1 hypothetical protein LF887_14105 [Chryseobacterium sp. MEBOG06]